MGIDSSRGKIEGTGRNSANGSGGNVQDWLGLSLSSMVYQLESKLALEAELRKFQAQAAVAINSRKYELQEMRKSLSRSYVAITNELRSLIGLPPL